jgi:hypothetical protein
MPTVINDTKHVEVQATLSDRWLMAPDDFAAMTGWTLKPEGLCRGDVCAPLYQPEAVLANGLIDLAGAAPLMGMTAVVDTARQIAALTTAASVRSDQMVSLQAPDFTLNNMAGEPVSLHDFDRRKVLLFAWSSW